MARLYGFERIAAHPPKVRATMLAVPEQKRSLHVLRERLAAAEYREVINFSFVEPGWEADFAGERDPIRLLNPIAAQMDLMRTTQWGGLIENLRANLNRKAARVRLFEIGRVFRADPAVVAGPAQVHGVAQPRRLA